MSTHKTFFIEQTSNFILENLDPNGLRILEVGCGDGDVALSLQRAGVWVEAIDTDREAIEKALDKGVNAAEIDFLDFNDDLFDAIIFTRSLHHIHHLEIAIQHAKKLLKPTGKLILEEFAVESIDEKTARWYYDMIDSLSNSGLIKESREQTNSPLEEWKSEHKHEPPLNTGVSMINEVEKVFENVEIVRNAYLYRSIGVLVNDEKLGYEITKHIFETEVQLIKKNLILPNGIRVVSIN